MDGQNALIAWPPRSPYLNPRDFYLWSRLQGLVHNLENLEIRVRNTVNELRKNIFESSEVQF